MAHEPRLTQALRQLLRTQRVAALGTCDADGKPFVSMVPFASAAEPPQLIIHVSRLAAHTGNLLRNPEVSLLIMQAEQPTHAVHDLPRVTVQGEARVLEPASAAGQSARAVYLARFPEAEMMTQLGDFCFIGIAIAQARHVAGFGAARNVDAEEMHRVLGAE